MFTPLIVEKFFITINYSRVEGGGETVDVVTVRKRIKDKVYKGEDKAFKYRTIIRDNRIKQ